MLKPKGSAKTLTSVLGKEDFDHSIKYGRDEKLFLKRETITSLSQQVRYTEQELQNLMIIYVNYAQHKAGLDIHRFSLMMESLYNIANHPLMPEIFSWFDTDNDGVVWYVDFVKGLDIVERGNFEQKFQMSWTMYNLFGNDYLDLITLRELFKRCYSQQIQ